MNECTKKAEIKFKSHKADKNMPVSKKRSVFFGDVEAIVRQTKCKYYNDDNAAILQNKITIKLKIKYWKQLVDDFVVRGVPDL